MLHLPASTPLTAFPSFLLLFSSVLTVCLFASSPALSLSTYSLHLFSSLLVLRVRAIRATTCDTGIKVGMWKVSISWGRSATSFIDSFVICVHTWNLWVGGANFQSVRFDCWNFRRGRAIEHCPMEQSVRDTRHRDIDRLPTPAIRNLLLLSLCHMSRNKNKTNTTHVHRLCGCADQPLPYSLLQMYCTDCLLSGRGVSHKTGVCDAL